MKLSTFFLTIFSSIILLSCNKRSITNQNHYQLSWDGKSSELKVEFSYNTQDREKTIFIYGDPRFGGQNDIFNVIGNIEVNKETDSLIVNRENREIIVYHKQAGHKAISYIINGNFKDEGVALYNELFRPVILNDFLYLTDVHFKLSSKDIDNDKTTINFENIPQNLTKFFNHELSEKRTKEGNYILPKNSFLVASSKIRIEKFNIDKIPYHYIYWNQENEETIDKNLKTFKEYFTTIRKFWKDYDTPYYYVSILPIYKGEDRVGGFGWGNGFSMKYKGIFGDTELYTVLHETSHYWVGGKLVLGGGSFDNQWFGEGFNDYITVINAAKSNVWSQQDFLNYINNQNFKKHYSSKYKDLHNDSIKNKYWIDSDVQKLPYRRGAIYAFYLDNQIRLKSSNKKSIRDLMQNLFKRTKTNNSENLTIKDFLEEGKLFLSEEELTNQIEKYMIKGEPIDLWNKTLASDVYVTKDEEGIPILGFKKDGFVNFINNLKVD